MLTVVVETLILFLDLMSHLWLSSALNIFKTQFQNAKPCTLKLSAMWGHGVLITTQAQDVNDIHSCFFTTAVMTFTIYAMHCISQLSVYLGLIYTKLAS